MAKTDRTIEDIRVDVADERKKAAEALEHLGNDVNDIIADLQRQAVEAGRKAAMVAPAIAVAVGTLLVLRRRRRRKRKAGRATEE
jgi:hypothetical protein